MSVFGKKLQEQTSGCRLSTYQLTTRRSMAKGQVERVAATFDAEVESVSGSRMAINRKHELVQPIYSALLDAKAFVNARTMDYPEKGVRLIRLDQIDQVAEAIAERQERLAGLCVELDAGWSSVVQDARERLGDLFSAADYPAAPSSHYRIELSFPAIKPDERLAVLHPKLYAEEQKRIEGKFKEAVDRAEAAAADELGNLLARFIDRLSDSEDGKKKVLKGTVVDSITEFAERFKSLSVGSNKELDKLVAQVQDLASGVDPAVVRKADQSSKDILKAKLVGFTEQIDKLIIVRPSRSIMLDE